MKIEIATVLTTVFLCQSCATYHTRPISAEKAAAEFEARTLNDPGLKTFIEKNLRHKLDVWPPPSWDLNLLTLVAFYYNPDLDVARAQWGVAKAGVLTAGERPNPTIGFSPEYITHSELSSPWFLGFTIDIPIETAGKRGYRIAQAKHLSQMAYLNIATVAWQVRSRLKTALLNLYAARESQTFLNKKLSLQTENVRLLKMRAAANSVSQIVNTDAELQRNQTLLALQDVKRKETQARALVATALGLPSTSLDGISFSFQFAKELVKNISPGALRKQALFNRWDILISLAEYAASEAALQLEVAKQYPDIHFVPGYAYDQSQDRWGFGFSMILPLFNRHKGPIAQAEARRRETETRFNALQTKVIGELDQALLGYQAELEKMETADIIIAAQREKYQFIKKSSGTGELRRVLLLQSESELDNAELSRLRQLMQTQQALGLLEEAIQKPLTVPEVRLAIPDTSSRNPTTVSKKEE